MTVDEASAVRLPVGYHGVADRLSRGRVDPARFRLLMIRDD
jgi:hypothetical protein